MLEKVFNVHVFNMEHGKSDDDIFDFALYLFPHYLKRAIKQGLFKQYRKREYNDANVRGAIDVTRHIRYNTPFNGCVAYRTSEYCYDNPVTQLIRHTIEYIRSSKWGKGVLTCDKDMRDAIRTIDDITPSYQTSNRQRVINQNLKPIKHPFYTEYTLLQSLCLQILLHKRVKYGKLEDKIYGILFDCAWLWEEYLATILCEKGFVHAVKGEKNGFQLYKGGNQRFPDFYSLDNGGIVLDAKYKRLNNGIQRNDLYQLIAYIHTLNNGRVDGCVNGAQCGAFIYPYDGEDAKKKEIAWKKLFGMGRYIGVIPIEIPNCCDSYESFVEQISQKEDNLAKIDFVKCLSNKNEVLGEISLCEE
jgi:5-methylcytosine-specific restriction endonuclease McrBC regulatory subunit McrC